MLTVYFWGTGSFAKKWLNDNMILFEFINHKKFIDRNHVPGTIKDFYNSSIISPLELPNEFFDYICIMSSFEKEIKEELIKTWHINESIIISVNQLSGIILERCYLHSAKEHRALFDTGFIKRIILDHLTKDDKNANELLNDYCDYQYLKRRYNQFAKENLHILSCSEKKISHTIIWTCWLQGYDSAPEIVKICIKSHKKYMPNMKIILITEDNFKEYINFPDFILKKYANGIISKTHFADLIRIELLTKYGGIWIDSTVLLTDKIPDYILKSPLFVFNIENKKKIDPRLAANWFIASEPKNNILMLTKTLLYRYWHENDYILNYFFFHYFFRMATEIYIDDWKNLYHMTVNATLLSEILFEPFDFEKYNFIKEISFCQKLSYKLIFPKSTCGTFYQKIIEENLTY